METSDLFCPVCKNKNLRGALVCVHCGAALGEIFRGLTTTGMKDVQLNDRSGFDAAVTIEDELIPADGIAIYIAGIDKHVSVSIQDELVFGRKIQEANEPMLDLSELGGFQMGISRRHAKIRRTGNGYEVIDLSSTNGTWLNNQRLTPEKPYPLANGAQVQMGRMRLYMFHRTGGDGKKR